MEVIREQIARPCSGVAAEQEVRKEVRWFLCRSYLLKLRRDEDREAWNIFETIRQ